MDLKICKTWSETKNSYNQNFNFMSASLKNEKNKIILNFEKYFLLILLNLEAITVTEFLSTLDYTEMRNSWEEIKSSFILIMIFNLNRCNKYSCTRTIYNKSVNYSPFHILNCFMINRICI